MQRIDNRKVPDIEKYDANSGETLEEYISKFEKYCKNNIKGDKTFWIPELEKHLSGKTLKTFSSMKDCKDNYKSLKKKLINWDKQTKKSRKRRARKKFENIKYEKNEELFFYSNRIEKLFKLQGKHINKLACPDPF